MIAFIVTRLAKEKKTEVDGAEEMGGAAICVWGHRGLSCALLLQTVAAFMAPNTEK